MSSATRSACSSSTEISQLVRSDGVLLASRPQAPTIPRLLPADALGFGLVEEDLGGLFANLLHLGDDAGEAATIGDPLLAEAGLRLGEPAGDGLAGVVAGPLPVGTVRLGRVGVAAAAWGSRVPAHVPAQHAVLAASIRRFE